MDIYSLTNKSCKTLNHVKHSLCPKMSQNVEIVQCLFHVDEDKNIIFIDKYEDLEKVFNVLASIHNKLEIKGDS